jgi:hypothetical protein
VERALPPGQLAELINKPQALVNEEAMAGLRASFDQMGAEGAELSQRLLDVLRTALASSIGDVFLIGTGVVAAAFVVTLLLKEMPLERRQPPGRQAGQPGS